MARLKAINLNTTQRFSISRTRKLKAQTKFMTQIQIGWDGKKMAWNKIHALVYPLVMLLFALWRQQ